MAVGSHLGEQDGDEETASSQPLETMAFAAGAGGQEGSCGMEKGEPGDRPLGPLGLPPFAELRLVPYLPSQVAFRRRNLLEETDGKLCNAQSGGGGDSCFMALASLDFAPVAKLCSALGEKLGVRGCDVAILSEKRVLDSGATLQDANVLGSTTSLDKPVELVFALRGQLAMTSPPEVRDLAAKLRENPPAYAVRQDLKSLFHLRTQSSANSWLRAGVCSTYGPRPANEDTHVSLCDWTTLPAGADGVESPAALFAVCDGHGGSWVSDKVSAELGRILREQLEVGSGFEEEATRKSLIERSFVALDAWLYATNNNASKRSGSTCVASIVWPVGDHFRVILANLGDSRGLVYHVGAGTLGETLDQKPDDPCEQRRIRQAGGYVLPADPPEPARLNSDLAMSRAFGDFRLKEDSKRELDAQKVTPVPDVYEFDASPGDILLLASDGVFDVMTSAEAAALALLHHSGDDERWVDDPKEAAATVVEAAIRRDTGDNSTALIVQLGTRTG
jgi:protein phosphatase 2C family protein 2/3